MLAERLPVHIEPVRLADTRRSFTGRMPIATMERLVGYLLENSGDADIELQFGRDEEGVRYLRGRIEAKVKLQCQRCLQEMEYAIDTELLMGIVGSEDAAERLAQHYDPLIVGRDPIVLKDLIEDELILALPLVATHTDSDCAIGFDTSNGRAEADSATVKRENPFAVLADLKIEQKH